MNIIYIVMLIAVIVSLLLVAVRPKNPMVKNYVKWICICLCVISGIVALLNQDYRAAVIDVVIALAIYIFHRR